MLRPVLLTVNVSATVPATTPAMLSTSERFPEPLMSESLSIVSSVKTLPLTVLVAVVLIPSLRLFVFGEETGSLLILMLMVAEVLACPPLP